MTTMTEANPVPAPGAEAAQLAKAAEHYKRAAHDYDAAAKKQAHGHDHEADHHVRHGAAHAAHAHEHAEAAAKLHATGVTSCGCSLQPAP